MEILQIDWQMVFNPATHLIFAYLLALPIGWDREHSKRELGLRTFPLDAVVTCGFMSVGKSVISSTDGEARVIQGIITGIGFIDGRAILKDPEQRLASPKSARRTLISQVLELGRRMNIVGRSQEGVRPVKVGSP